MACVVSHSFVKNISVCPKRASSHVRVPCGVKESPLCVIWVSVSAICQKRICLSKTCLQPYLMCCKVKKSLPVNSLSVCVSHLFIWARHLQGLRPLGLDTQCTSGLPKVRGLRPEYMKGPLPKIHVMIRALLSLRKILSLSNP